MILSLHTDILICLFSEWIELTDLTVLDSALCSKNLRSIFVDIVCGDKFIHETTNCYTYESIDQFHNWLDLRSIRVKNFCFNESSEKASLISKRILSRLKSLRHFKIRFGTIVGEILTFMNGNIDEMTLYWSEEEEGSASDDLLLKLLPQMCKVKLLDLQLSQDDFTDHSLSQLHEFMPNLRDIDLGESVISHETVLKLLRSCKTSLKKFTVSCYPHTSDQQFLNIIENCPQVVDLSAYCCTSLLDSTFRELPKHCPKIESLNVQNCDKLTDTTMTLFARSYPNLRSLQIGNCDCLSDRSLIALSLHCPQLTSVHMRRCDITDNGVVTLATNCPLLKLIDMGACAEISDISVIALATHCPRLECVHLADCKKVSDYSVFQLIEKCPFLAFLGIEETAASGSPIKFAAGCNEVTFLGYSDLDQLPGVEVNLSRKQKCSGRLEFTSWGCHLSSATRHTLVYSCPHLTKLCIDMSIIASADILKMVAMCPLLRDVRLRCKNIQTDVIVQLTQHCPHLHSLAATHVPLLTDDLLVALVEARPFFRHLDMQNSLALTDDSILKVAECCPKLETLNVYNCLLVTSTSIRAVLDSCPRLTELSVHSDCLSGGGGALSQVISDQIRKRDIAFQVGGGVAELGVSDEDEEGDEPDMLHHIQLLDEAFDANDSDSDSEGESDGEED